MLILIIEKDLQALEKITYSNYWITILLMLLFIGIVLLKAISASRLKGAVFGLFNVNFIEIESEENKGFFDFFQIVIFFFSVLVLSLLVYRFKLYKLGATIEDFSSFYLVFLGLLCYFSIKRILEYSLSYLFLLKKEVRFFIISKYNYLHAVCFLLYIAIVLSEYTSFSMLHLFYLSGLLFIIPFLFHTVINKKLIFKGLFYFILYLCAFEIAPLFILFKLMF